MRLSAAESKVEKAAVIFDTAFDLIVIVDGNVLKNTCMIFW